MPKTKKIIISVDPDGDCAISSPADLDLDEVLDILASALEAAAEKAEQRAHSEKELFEEPIAAIKKTDYQN